MFTLSFKFQTLFEVEVFQLISGISLITLQIPVLLLIFLVDPYGSVSEVTALHVLDMNFKPYRGHFNL